MKKAFYLFIITNTFLIVSCATKNERDFKPKDQLIESKDQIILDRSISFKNDINPIIQSKCIDCHKAGSTNPNSPGDYFFTDYEGFKKKAVELYTGSDKSKIEFRITSSDPNIRMPFLLDPLSNDQISLIKTWIAQGAQNN